MNDLKFMPINQQNHKYYYVDNDLQAYPDAWCYLIYSKRGPGKTYSMLDLLRRSEISFVYLKRTMDDVKNLAAGSQKDSAKEKALNLSPFAPINRDMGTNIRCFEIEKGIAGFYECEFSSEDQKYHPYGMPLGYVFAVSAIAKYKGFNLTECDFMIYDEFIPMPWERVSTKEGEAVLSLYNTVSRDRVLRGLPELKLVCLANATRLNNQLFDVLEVIDTVADMEVHKIGINYDDYRGILIHKIMDSEFPEAIAKGERKLTGIERAMQNTAFGAVEYGGNFAYDSNVHVIDKTHMKQFKPVCSFIHRTTTYYVYKKQGQWYICKSRHDRGKCYNLSDDVQAHQFWKNYCFDIRLDMFEDRVTFECYSAYNIIYNYKKMYNIER